MKYIDDYKNPKAAEAITKKIAELAKKLPGSINIMEVCGSHTMAIAKYGIRELLPDNISLISGPGCPVCVTDSGYIDTAIDLAEKGVIIATFGDMVNVPGSTTTLAKARSAGARIEICYSPLSAIELAQKDPDKKIVFLAIGFETTIAPIMGLLEVIRDQKITNLSILTAFKLVPPALEALASDPEIKIDALLCPAHVSAIIGEKAYEAFAGKYKIPCVIASFEPVDILYGLQGILEQFVKREPRLENQYKRVVKHDGNLIAQKLISKYLIEDDVLWRGIGVIPKSGLRLRPEFANYDTEKVFKINVKPGKTNKGCLCGEVLKGKIKPSDCPLFSKACNPLHPIGPCMVSSEGSCAAYFKYMRNLSKS